MKNIIITFIITLLLININISINYLTGMIIILLHELYDRYIANSKAYKNIKI